MIPLNAFSTIALHGLIQKKNNELIPKTFQRGVSRQGDIWDVGYPSSIRPDGFPVRPPSKLPPPGNENLSIALGERIGSGRVGTVYEAILLTDDYVSCLPPLVVKISRRKRSESIEKEAWFYEELEQLQGIAVPRCYGFFQTRVEEGVEVLTWNDIDNDYVEDDEVDEEGFPALNKEAEGSTLLSILLLERLGWNIPLGYKDFDYSYIKTDVYEIYNDLARVGIEHVDFRWNNILSVLQYSEDGPLGPACPHHGHAHVWRIIDLDLARKTNFSIECLECSYDSHLRPLFDNAPNDIAWE